MQILDPTFSLESQPRGSGRSHRPEAGSSCMACCCCCGTGHRTEPKAGRAAGTGA